MKARKSMKNQQLIAEVTSQVAQRFTPQISDIKKVSLIYPFSISTVLTQSVAQAIDHLLEKEYISRVEGTRDTFDYVA